MNQVTSILVAVIAACFVGIAACLAAMLSGCAVPPEEALADTMQGATLPARLEAVTGLCELNSRASLEALLEAFEMDPETREEVASALVLRGRRWYAQHGQKPGLNTNRVIDHMAFLAARSDIDPSIRAKAVWVIAEIGDRHAKDEIAAAYAGDSQAVSEEVSRSLDKLGFTSNAHPMECLADGSLSAFYDPQKRGHLEGADE